ncbi:unnamed protein product [Fraxinus pennsylvanica]|uniref:Ribosomal RNA-processing protein 42 n=1 Tax=Fraxinus pennsylvanica TaxID=56036 RepID=A0AAD1Z853_9LAMI|nr:unnamed protein product [Fraxinus pennsylvanica]
MFLKRAWTILENWEAARKPVQLLFSFLHTCSFHNHNPTPPVCHCISTSSSSLVTEFSTAQKQICQLPKKVKKRFKEKEKAAEKSRRKSWSGNYGLRVPDLSAQREREREREREGGREGCTGKWFGKSQDGIASVKAELGKPMHLILTKERFPYMLIAVQQQNQLLRYKESDLRAALRLPSAQRGHYSPCARRDCPARGVLSSGDPSALRRDLDPTALKTIPAVIYYPNEFKDRLECAVCLSEVSLGEKTRNENESSSNSSSPEETAIQTPIEENSCHPPNFPTNVLFWGNETHVITFGPCLEDSHQGIATATPFQPTSSSSLASTRNRPDGMLVIDIPRQGRGSEELSVELSTALQRCLLGGKSGAGAGIDLSSLSIVEGKVCWDIYIDGLVVSSDGNLLDALGAAIKAALSNTAIPKVEVAANASSDEQPEVDVSDEEFLPFRHNWSPCQNYVNKGWQTLNCRCNSRRGVPNEFSRLHFCP